MCKLKQDKLIKYHCCMKGNNERQCFYYYSMIMRYCRKSKNCIYMD